MPIPFIKMHGLGNDFVILDARVHRFVLTPEAIRAIGDRNRGIGFDQLIVLEEARDPRASLFMAIYNRDGSRVQACGNGTRCVARLEMDKAKRDTLFIETDAGLLTASRGQSGIAVDMGMARTEWEAIPLAHAADTLKLDVNVEGLPVGVGVNIGNPHIVFFMENAETVDVARLGPRVETYPLFPEKTNVEFAHIVNRTAIRMRVWERGAGITQACGSAACATIVAAVQRGLTDRKAELILDGGTLILEWLANGHVTLQGPASLSFTGELADEMLGIAQKAA